MRLPLVLTLRPSLTLAAALIAAHGVAIWGLVSAKLSFVIALPAVMLILAMLALILRRQVLGASISALSLKADGTLEVLFPDGSSCFADVLSQTTVFPWLVTLLLRVDGRKMALALPPDALGKEAHRQLRLWLRWKVSAATA